MPPLWFIVGIAFVLVFWWLADRSVLRPGAARVMVDGREVLIRRKRDSQFVIAVMMALFTGVVVVGAVIEEDAGLLPLAVFFGGFMLAALWRPLVRGKSRHQKKRLGECKDYSRKHGSSFH